MTRRETLIARSVVHAILTTRDDGTPAHKPSLVARAFRLFRLYWLTFQLVRSDLFTSLRGIWSIPEDDYKASFGAGDRSGKKAKNALQPMSDMGYSGSTFFRTSDGAYLIKSVPRSFEHNFFKNDMLLPYAEHMQANRASLLIRITDFLESAQASIGILLGLAPSHHIIMENLLHGQDQEAEGGAKDKWETWDLKPTSYFYPERDVAGGALTSEATKSKLADKFDDKLLLSRDEAVEFQAELQKDTKLLADCNVVDYSLFLVRISAEDTPYTDSQPSLEPGQASNGGTQPSFSPPSPPTWRTGITSSDEKQVYRAAVLDFFWAKHTVHAKAMTGLINGYNLIDEQGPMSITTESKEYRVRFLQMCEEMVEIQD
ncbi:Uu.00g145360.m01.CDS01 [Anthostomella pinea]|uniref:Uu.00g145360.m01.CDS01 n=1 Tax=Anthostomella pinea TaxID=933095 RepID=A0AAI8VR24_9PEZI|nr:Uu.00g145360.m01.CDS01 [Anthostomella pinea]